MKSNKRIVTIALLTCMFWPALLFLSGKSFKTITWREMSPLFGILIILGIKELKDYINFLKYIKKGIDLIKNGYSWNTHYLIITKNPDNEHEILATNDLLWIEEGNKKSYSEEILVKMLALDFEKIAKNSQLKNFLRNRKVVYKLSKLDKN